ncbi:MAG TPA: carboxypeptidase-like regulatory domain-containing protein [Acidobacteriaceae bacterium]|nr:carboxypeptidase-like regulatory domain-containing protein [Acidobacteriaceae bacterium]
MAPKFTTLARLAAILALLLGPSGLERHASAQVTYAQVHGTVLDPSGAVVPNATVTVLNTSTGISTTASTDSHGYYILPQLQIGGPYTVDITAPGFEKFESTGLTLNLNDNRGIDARLQVGSSVQTVQVQAAAVQVETADTQLKQVITARQIEEAPLLGRDASGLQKLQPGTMESSDDTGNYSANGSQTQANSYLLNGADNNDGPLQSEGFQINPDAIEEETIVTSTINPEFARNSGAIINQVIKAGDNAFHGDAFEFYRDTFLSNGSYFAPTRPPYHLNLYGGTLGGPVIKNRLFFFAAYQALRSSVGKTQLSPVFDQAQLAGDFTADQNFNPSSTSSSPLSDNPMPFSVNGCPAGTPWSACFPTRVQVGSASYDPVASKLLTRFMPAPNRVINGAAYYAFNAPNTGAEDQGVLRADYHLSNNDSLWASGLFQSSPSANALGYGGSDLPGFGTHQAEHYKLFMASWTHTFNSSTLNELRAGYYRLNFAAVEPASVVQPGSYGFNITPQSPQSGLPLMNVAGLNGTSAFLGFTYEGPQPRRDSNLTAADAFTKIVGNHSLKFGVSWEQFVVNNPYYSTNNGSYSYAGGGIYSSGDPILDFVLGIPDQYSQASGSIIDAASHEYYAYGQDSWKISNDLTLNYGMVWDVETPTYNHQFRGLGITCWSISNQTSNVFPGGPPGLTYPTDPGCNTAGGPTTKWSHFGPRVGFAWSPSSGPAALLGSSGAHDFAIRGGFGMYYNRDAEEGQLQNLGDPPYYYQTRGIQDQGPAFSPGFANPFADVAGNGSEPNPFPFVPPGAGSQLNWPNYAGLQISTYPKNYAVPYIYNFNLNIQRSLPSNMVLQVGYVGSLGRKLVRAYEGDPITAAGHNACLADPACSANPAFLSLAYPQYKAQPATIDGFPWYLSVGQQHTDGASSYHSLQASLTKGPTHGLYFTLAYTYSHALDNASGLESSGFNAKAVNFVPGFGYLSYGNSDYDARNRFVASYNYEVPLLASWSSNLAARELLGGWHISGITALQSGFPITIKDEGIYNSLYCDAFSYYYCPDTPNTSTFKIKSLNPRSANHTWFDNSVFSQEPLGTFGNVGRNFFHGPGFNYTNMSLFKNLPFGREGERYVQLRLDAFNVFNHANFANPASNFTSGPSRFGVITAVKGTYSSDVNGDPVPGRAVELGGKIYF